MSSRTFLIAVVIILVVVVAALSLTTSAGLISLPDSLSVLSRSAAPDAAAAANTATGKKPLAAVLVAPPTVDAAAWYAAREVEPEQHGVLIETVDRKRVFASHNANQTFNPASLTKLATSLIALRKLGADFRFQTSVYADGVVDSAGTLRGKLYVFGGDPIFGDAAANLIGQELRARGIKRISEGLVVSPNFCFNFTDLPLEAATRLERALNLVSMPTFVADQPAGKRLFVLEGNPLADVLLYMNAHSNNLVADRLSAETNGPEALQRFLVRELRLAERDVYIESASGLGRNRMTPRDMLSVIRALIEETNRQGLRPEDIMPVANYDSSTLRHRFIGSGLEGSVIGKTGTLTTIDGGMASVAGIIYTTDAGMILFAIFDQGPQVWENRQLEDQLLAETVATAASPRLVMETTQSDGTQDSELRGQNKTEIKPRPRQLLPPSQLRINQVARDDRIQEPRAGIKGSASAASF